MRGTELSLAPGDYGRLEVARDSTVRLADGDYVFESVNISRNVTITFTAGTNLVVVGSMVLDREVTVVPAEAATPQHPPLPVAVLGADGDTARPAADPAVRIGRDGQLDLSLIASAGTVTVDRGTAVRGSIIAIRIALARDIHVTYAATSSVAPVVVLDEPRDGATVGGQVTLRASETTGADVTRVDFLVDDVVVGSAASAPFELVWDASALPDGDHTVAAVGVDRQGRTGTGGPVNVTVVKESDAQSRLADDFASGAISLEEYVTFGVYRWSQPDRVPATYQVTDDFSVSDLTVSLAMSLAFLSDLDPATQAELRAYLSPESAVDREVVPLTDEEMDAALAPLWAEFEGAGAELEGEDLALGAELGSLGAGLVAAQTSAEDEPLMSASFGTVTCGEDSWRQTVMKMNSLVLDCTYDTKLAKFYWSDSAGSHDIPWTDVQNAYLQGDAYDPRPNGVPDEIDVVASSLYQASAIYRDMGYANPPKMMVGVADYGGDGLAVPELGHVYVDRGMGVDESAPSDPGVPVYLARHELFHQYQYQYADWRRIALDYGAELDSTTGWWLEATAEWASHKAQEGAWGSASETDEYRDALGRYASNLSSHLVDPTQALATFTSPFRHSGQPRPQYGSFLFAEYLEEKFGESVILQTWQAQQDAGPRAMTAIRNVVESYETTSFEDVVANYHKANYRIAEQYRDPDRQMWVDRLAATSGRPGHEALVLEPGKSYPLTLTIEAGGAAYIDLEVLSSNPDGVTFDLSVDAGNDPAAGHLRTQIEYSNDYPRHCELVDRRPVTETYGHAEHSTTIAPSCSLATVIVSHTGADTWGLRGNEEQALTVQITVTAHITTAETVVEYWGGFQHNRVNVGESLDRWLTPAEDFNALFEIDMGTAVSEGRHGYVLHAYSIDRAPRSTDVIWVNGTRLEVEHRRRAAVSDGRYAVYLGQPGWSIPNLSSWTIPDELITDGLNTFSIVLEGDLYVYGAYVSSYSYVEPDPDPDPDPCPDCPVAS